MGRNTALVYGGVSQLAWGIGERLIELDYSLVLSDRLDPVAAASSVARLKSGGKPVPYIAADIARPDERFRLLQTMDQRYGLPRWLLLLPSETLGTATDPMAVTEERFNRWMDVEVRGTFFLAQTTARLMQERHQADPTFQGRILLCTPAPVADTARVGLERVVSAARSALAAALATALAGGAVEVYAVELTAGTDEDRNRELRTAFERLSEIPATNPGESARAETR